MLSTLAIFASANAACVDLPSCNSSGHEPWAWNCAAPGQGWSGNCNALTSCQKSCSSSHGTTCEQVAEARDYVCANGDATMKNGIDNGGTGPDPNPPSEWDPETCGDSGHMDCTGAYAWNCAVDPTQGDKDTLMYCRGKCAERYGAGGVEPKGLTCQKMKDRYEEILAEEAGSGGGGGPGPIGVDGCTRLYDPPHDATWPGYIANFKPERDGVIEHIGQDIHVVKAPTTPSWCQTSVSQPSAGSTMHFSEYYKMVGLAKLQCVGWTESSHTAATCKFGTCQTKLAGKNVFDYEYFSQAAGYFPDFANYDNFDQSALDLAAFVAHSSKETMGAAEGQPLAENAWCWSTEQGFAEGYVDERYGTQSNPQGNGAGPAKCLEWSLDNTPAGDMDYPEEFAPNFPTFYPWWNKGYYGRGSIQLTYCTNYNYFAQWVANELGLPQTPETDFLSNPGYVGTKDWSFASGLWYYMSPSSDGMKPSMHSMVNYWKPGTALPVDNHGRKPDIGYQTQILNGGEECGTGGRAKENAGKHYVKWRSESFLDMLKYMNYTGDASQYAQYQESCLDSDNMSIAYHVFWQEGDLKCSGDSISFCEDDSQCFHQPNSEGGTGPEPTEKPETTTVEVVVPPTPSSKTTTTTKAIEVVPPPPTGDKKCCVRSSALAGATQCQSASNQSACDGADACIWTLKTQCVDHVIADGSIVDATTTTTSAPANAKKCCVLSSQIAKHAECVNSSEGSCNSNNACTWVNAELCVDTVSF